MGWPYAGRTIEPRGLLPRGRPWPRHHGLATTMNEESSDCQRRPERIAGFGPHSPLDAFRPSGRRSRPRRSEERADMFFSDRFGAFTLAMIVTLLSLTIVDGVLTPRAGQLQQRRGQPLHGPFIETRAPNISGRQICA